MSEVSYTLAQARALIADPKHWAKHVSARNAENQKTGIYEPDAVCFCASAAVLRVSRTAKDPYLLATVCLRILDTHARDLARHSKNAGRWSCDTVSFNDNDLTTHEEILDLFDRAIGATA